VLGCKGTFGKTRFDKGAYLPRHAEVTANVNNTGGKNKKERPRTGSTVSVWRVLFFYILLPPSTTPLTSTSDYYSTNQLTRIAPSSPTSFASRKSPEYNHRHDYYHNGPRVTITAQSARNQLHRHRRRGPVRFSSSRILS